MSRGCRDGERLGRCFGPFFMTAWEMWPRSHVESAPKHYALVVTDLPNSANESAGHSLPKELTVFTKLFTEPVVTVGSSFRSGSHPILQVKIAAEVARSPKVGLIGKLMDEGREAFIGKKYRTALVKFLAVEELLRKYGDILVCERDGDLRGELEFLKIHFYLLSGQAAEACRTLKNLNYKGSSYLAHRRYALRYELDHAYWENLGTALRQIFSTNGSGRIFALLGYVTVMGPQPYVAKSLSLELGFTPHAGDDVFQPFLLRHHGLVSDSSPADAQWLPEYLATHYRVTPLGLYQNVLYVGSSRPLSRELRKELQLRTGYDVVELPVIPERVMNRNCEIYGIKKSA